MISNYRNKTLADVISFAENRLFTPNDCLVVALSGGADSVALLDILSSLPDYNLKLVVAHLNHRLRAEESDADESFARCLSAGYNLPFESVQIDVTSLAAQNRISIEEAGREARYAFFEDVRLRHNAAAIAVAHHANDQAETFLLRLLRGAGPSGLSAMSPVNNRKVIRPLLGLTSAEIRRYLSESGLSFREDSSNMDKHYLRNRIRHELLPLLTEYNPAIIDRLASTASLIAEDNQLLERFVYNKYKEIAIPGKNWVAFRRDVMAGQDRAMRMGVYREAILRIYGSLRRLALKHFKVIDELLTNGATGSRTDLPSGLGATLSKGFLIITTEAATEPEPPVELTVKATGRFDTGNGITLVVEKSEAPQIIKGTPPETTYIDAEKAPFPWIIRELKSGDRIAPLGMNGNRLASDILSESGIPLNMRKSIPVLSSDKGLLWIPGFKRSGIACLTPESRETLKITAEGMELLKIFTKHY